MDTTLKQRILGVVVLVGLLGFCLTVLLRNTKTQPHIVKINTHPPFAQTMPTAETQNVASLQQVPNSVFAKPATTPASPATTNTTTQKSPNMQTHNGTIIQTAAAPTPVIVSTPAGSTVTQPVIQPTQNAETQKVAKTQNVAETQNVASLQQPEANQAAEVTSKAAVTTTPTTKLAPSHERSHHRQRHHHAVVSDKSLHKKESSRTTATAGDKKNLMVQVGTFSLPANAETMVDKLHSKGFSAIAEKMKTSKGEMTRVIVGKKGLNHAEAETLRKSLEKSMNLNGIIISHAKD